MIIPPTPLMRRLNNLSLPVRWPIASQPRRPQSQWHHHSQLLRAPRHCLCQCLHMVSITSMGLSTWLVTLYIVDPAPLPEEPQLDDFRVEYHPNSGRGTKVYRFHEFIRGHDAPPPPVNKRPWWPFRSRAEFEFSEIVLKAALNKEQVDGLLALFHRILRGEDSFTFT